MKKQQDKTSENKKAKKGFFYYIEKGGNALPHPAILFGLFALATLLLSLIGSLLGWQATHPATGEQIESINLISREGLHRIILEMVNNYTSFAPLGIVMVALLGFGVAEASGLIRTSVNALLAKTPASAITFMIVFTGVISSIGSDIGYILVIPLGGIIFHSVGRNPIAGLSAAFAGVSAGFGANVLISTLDPLLAGISTEAANIIDPDYYVLPTANYYFSAVSAIFISILGTIVTDRWIEPRLGKYTGDVEREEIKQPTVIEKKGLRNAGLVFLIWTVIIMAGLIPQNGILRGADGSDAIACLERVYHVSVFYYGNRRHGVWIHGWYV
jgi:aminobenzoyl-glutamate transport protein